MPESAQQLTEACGPGVPGPYGVVKDIWAAVAGIPPALRRHLPLTREAGGTVVPTTEIPRPIRYTKSVKGRY